MDAELQREGQAKLGDGKAGHAQALLEFLLEEGEAAHVIDAAVEAPREFRRDGLAGHVARAASMSRISSNSAGVCA